MPLPFSTPTSLNWPKISSPLVFLREYSAYTSTRKRRTSRGEKENPAVTFVRESRRIGLSSSRDEKGRREGEGRGGKRVRGGEERVGGKGGEHWGWQQPERSGHDAQTRPLVQIAPADISPHRKDFLTFLHTFGKENVTLGMQTLRRGR